MTSRDDFDRLVADWLETAGPSAPDAAVVDAALGSARRFGQARGVRGWLVSPMPWPRTSTWRPIKMTRLVWAVGLAALAARSEEHTSELQALRRLVCRL